MSSDWIEAGASQTVFPRPYFPNTHRLQLIEAALVIYAHKLSPVPEARSVGADSGEALLPFFEECGGFIAHMRDLAPGFWQVKTGNEMKVSPFLLHIRYEHRYGGPTVCVAEIFTRFTGFDPVAPKKSKVTS